MISTSEFASSVEYESDENDNTDFHSSDCCRSRSTSLTRPRTPKSHQQSQHHLHHSTSTNLVHFYEDDEVCRLSKDGKIQFGMVGHSEVKKRGAKNVKQDQLKIFWTLGNKIECEDLFVVVNSDSNNSHIRIIDRKVKEGDLIKVKKREGQVLQVKFIACLKCMENNEAIVDVPCENLEPVVMYNKGQKFAMDGWVGVITSVETHASLMFSNGKTCNVNLSKIPNSKRPYPGSKVVFKLEEYLAAGAVVFDTGEKLQEVFEGVEFVTAFVIFVKVYLVEVDWKFQLPCDSNNPVEPPPKTFRRSSLKKHGKLIEPPTEILWGSDDPELYEQFYRYTIRKGDMVLAECSKNLERLLIRQLFPENVQKDFVRSVGVNNVSYVVRVLRTTRVLTVKWKDDGSVETIRSSSITSKQNFQEPWHHIVQKKGILGPSLPDKYGITLNRKMNDMVNVQWFLLSSEDEKAYPIRLDKIDESKYDLEPHYRFGKFSPGDIVYRSPTCKIPPALFSYGVVLKVTPGGFVVVEDTVTKRECSLLPFEILGTKMSAKRNGDAGWVGGGEEIRNDLEVPFGEIKAWHNSVKKTLSDVANNDVETLAPDEKFMILPTAPESHTFYGISFKMKDEFKRVVSLDREVLNQIFTEGIWVRGYHDRLDLYSAMIVGTKHTLYEDGLFHFDIQLPPAYSRAPPEVYLTTQLNAAEANLRLRKGQIDFKELGMNNPVTILETLLILQRTLFSQEENPSLETNELTPIANSFSVMKKIESSRSQNALIIMSVVDSVLKLVNEPPELWKSEVIRYGMVTLPKISKRLRMLLKKGGSGWDKIKKTSNPLPYHLLPLSQGFLLAIQNRIEIIQELSQATDGFSL